MDTADLRNFIQQTLRSRLIADVTCVMSRVPAGFGNFRPYCRRIVFIDVENANCSTRGCELQRDRPTDAAAGACNNRSLAVKTELAATGAQSDTPRFQGMKSSWFFFSALVWSSPLAT